MASNQERLASGLHEFSIPPDRAVEIAAWIANVKPPILMSDLPIPDIGEISGIADWRVNSWDVSVYPDSNGHPAMIHIENRTRMTKPYVFNSRKAREFGEAMIAAANHAEQEQGMEEIDHELTDEIVCPWCGHEYTDSWEMDDYETSDCDECGKPFTLSRHVSVTYDTEKVEEDA